MSGWEKANPATGKRVIPPDLPDEPETWFCTWGNEHATEDEARLCWGSHPAIKSPFPLPVQSRAQGNAASHIRPSYYQAETGMQPFDVIDAFGLDFYEGSALKYLLRWRKKNGAEDLRKCATYIAMLIQRAEEAGPAESTE